MGVLKLEGFTGMLPVRDARALPANAAVDATNIRVDGGAYLKGARTNTLIKALSSSTRAVFRIPLPGANTLANSYWKEFTDIDTDVVQAPIVNDQYARIYWASPSTGLKFAPKASLIAGSAGFTSGVPAPTTAPTLDIVAGTGEIEDGENIGTQVTRAYAASFVNEYGEEGQLGPSVEGTGAIDQDWLVQNIPQPGSPGTRAAYQEIRLYRTVTGLTGATAFYKVADIAIGTTFFMDRLADATVTGQGEAETANYGEPPTGLQGLASMPNGIFVSWKDNTLYFSENYRPHSWPAEYAITVDFPIVGLGVFGNTCVVCTTGTPAAVSGVKASALTLTKSDANLPCLSRQSIVSAPEGVYYASEEGLVLFGPSGVGVVTSEYISRDLWRDDYAPPTIRAMMVGGEYVAMRTPATGTSDGFRFRPLEPTKFGVSKIEYNINVHDVGVEPYTGKPYLIGADSNLYELEVPGAGSLSYTWLSREFVYPYPVNFSVCQAYFDSGAGGPVHAKLWVTLRGNDGGTSRVLVYEADIAASGREVKLPSGFKSDVWQIELSGAVELQSFLMASTVAELRNA